MSLESLLYDLDNTINLSYSYCTDISQFWDSSVPLRHTPCHNQRFFYFFGLLDHRDEGIL
jgi:hypothetical protein